MCIPKPIDFPQKLKDFLNDNWDTVQAIVPEYKKTMMKDFFEDFKNELKKRENLKSWKVDEQESYELGKTLKKSTGFTLRLTGHEHENWDVRVQFDDTNYRNAFYGIRHLDDYKLPFDFEEFNKKFPTDGLSPSWPWWKWFHEYRDWDNPQTLIKNKNDIQEIIFDFLKNLQVWLDSQSRTLL